MTTSSGAGRAGHGVWWNVRPASVLRYMPELVLARSVPPAWAATSYTVTPSSPSPTTSQLSPTSSLRNSRAPVPR